MMTIMLLILMEIPEVGSRYTVRQAGCFAAAEIGGSLGAFQPRCFFQSERELPKRTEHAQCGLPDSWC